MNAGDVTHFHGFLPPARGHSLPPSKASPGALILHTLAPLRDELDAALARGDREAALRIAYRALARTADGLATVRGDRLQPSQVRIHALWVELEPLPFASEADGTVSDQGASIRVSYRNWAVPRAEATAWAARLTERFSALWPGAWVMMAGA
jgi:hypothetical protein